MKSYMAVFRFTLSPSQSIGPTQLHALWANACQTPQVSVARNLVRGRPTYSLYAGHQLRDLPEVERRLRRLLEENKLNASLTAMHSH
ncbi:hypothetical protein [Marilutibacter maris]|uniref:Uncharacterized protein n=1 Tax=Marilutibacter maris TaxID=1605891 RepID=A0A2U9T7L4_9GAMM|nr:hypothetical protein [Lysobacter maris]AWV07552.1 hypothetical protein C9I47_1863 [Lysobacter maris]